MASHTNQIRTIAMMNQKGGVGKTTTTANLGAALAEHDAHVLLIDLDPQAHLTLHVGVDPDELEISNYELLTYDDVSVEMVAHSLNEHLDLLPAEVNLAGAESELVSRPDRLVRLKKKIAPVIDQYDYILVDCPPSLGLLTLNALALVREVVVPMQAHFLALQGLSKLLETVQLVRQQVNPELKVAGVVLCMHDAQTNLAQEVVGDLGAFFEAGRGQDLPWAGAKIYEPPIRRNIKLAECPSFGQTIFQYSPWCPGARDYSKLAEALLTEDGHPITSTPEPAEEA